MKSNTTRPYNFTGDYYGYTLVTSADGTVTNKVYAFSGKVLLDISVIENNTLGVIGDLQVITKNKLQLNSYLKSVLDRNGSEIFEGGVWEIVATYPLIDGLGVKIGYKYHARLIEGNI